MWWGITDNYLMPEDFDFSDNSEDEKPDYDDDEC